MCRLSLKEKYHGFLHTCTFFLNRKVENTCSISHKVKEKICVCTVKDYLGAVHDRYTHSALHLPL
jgi:hypothetical protein